MDSRVSFLKLTIGGIGIGLAGGLVWSLVIRLGNIGPFLALGIVIICTIVVIAQPHQRNLIRFLCSIFAVDFLYVTCFVSWGFVGFLVAFAGWLLFTFIITYIDQIYFCGESLTIKAAFERSISVCIAGIIPLLIVLFAPRFGIRPGLPVSLGYVHGVLLFMVFSATRGIIEDLLDSAIAKRGGIF